MVPIDDLKVTRFGIPKIKNGSRSQNLEYRRRSSLQLVSEEND